MPQEARVRLGTTAGKYFYVGVGSFLRARSGPFSPLALFRAARRRAPHGHISFVHFARAVFPSGYFFAALGFLFIAGLYIALAIPMLDNKIDQHLTIIFGSYVPTWPSDQV